MKSTYVILAAIIALLLSSCGSQSAQFALEEENAVLQDDLAVAQSELQKTANDLLNLKAEMQTKSNQLESIQKEVEELRVQLETADKDRLFYQNMVEEMKGTQTGTQLAQQPPKQHTVAEPGGLLNYEDEYDAALQLYYGGQFSNSLRKFTELLSYSQNHKLADNCQYWVGENHYSLGNYMDAITAFDKVRDMGDANKAEAAQFKIVLSYLKLGDRTKAVQASQALERMYPQSSYIAKAQQYLSNY